MITAFSGTSSERNTTISSRNDSASTAPKKYGSRDARYAEKSTLHRDGARDRDVDARRALGRWQHVVAQAVHELGGGLSCGAVVGTTFHSTAVGSSGLLRIAGDAKATPGSAATASCTASERGRIGAGGELGHQDRAVR